MAKDYLLVIDGIKGESSDDKIKDAIELSSWGVGVANTGSMASGGGGGAGKANFSDFAASAASNVASTELMVACATGRHIKKAVLHVRKQGGAQETYLTVTMTDCLISQYNTGDSPGGDVAVIDSFAINYAQIEFEYKPQKEDGTLGSAIKGGYSLKANKKI
jgi:type VI secretion system secreted protein Hcp